MRNILLDKRFLEIVTGSASIIIIAFLFIGSYFIPFVIAVLLIAFDCYWLYKSFWFAVNSLRVYRLLYYSTKNNYQSECEKIKVLDETIVQTREEIKILEAKYHFKKVPKFIRFLFKYSSLKKPFIEYIYLNSKLKEYNNVNTVKDQLLNSNDIHHLVIIPEWKEPIEVLDETIKKIYEQDYPLDHISVVLATESRDPQADSTAQILIDKYAQYFKHFWITKHPIVEGEVVGKSSNMAYAGKWAASQLEAEGYDLKKVTVTSCDADSLLPNQYFAYVTYKYITDTEREFHFYHGAIMYYENFWEVPFPIRMLVTFSSIWNLSHLINASLLPLSTYTLSLDSVRRAGWWSVDVIPEDFHIFFKTFFALGPKVKVIPIFLPIYSSAPQSSTYWKTIQSQYSQMKRWAWGISDDQFIIRESFTHKEIPLLDKITNIFRPLEEHITWPVNWFLITIGANLPPLFNKDFAKTNLGYRLPTIAQVILTICLGALFTIIIVETRVRPKPRTPWPWWKKPMLLIQWFTLPFVTLFLSALPGLDAHTRLLLGKRLEYKVTEKVRKPD